MKGNNPTYGESTPCMALVCLKPFPYLGKEIKGHQHVVLFRCCFRLFLFIALFVIQSLQYTDKELMAAALASDDMKSIEVTCSPFRVPMMMMQHTLLVFCRFWCRVVLLVVIFRRSFKKEMETRRHAITTDEMVSITWPKCSHRCRYPEP